ncbi:MAG: HAD family hydrolase [Capsulimonadaceae bacterium]
MYSTVLFDFDGTLVPSLDLWLQAFQYALSRYERTLPVQTIIDRFYYRDYQDICDEFDLPNGDELRDHVHAGLDISLKKAEPCEGVLDVLRYLCASGRPTGLVTTSPRAPVMDVLCRLEIENLFDIIVTGDDVEHCKPHPEPILLALRRLDEPIETALMVGDYVFDVVAGRAAGTSTALYLPEIHRPFYDFDALSATGPTMIFHHYSELLSILKSGTGARMATPVAA